MSVGSGAFVHSPIILRESILSSAKILLSSSANVMKADIGYTSF